MAIKVENITVGGRQLVRHESDADVYIRQIETGIEYAVAVDVVPCRYTYEETERVIEERTEIGEG